jgi:hypothetical protein
MSPLHAAIAVQASAPRTHIWVENIPRATTSVAMCFGSQRFVERSTGVEPGRWVLCRRWVQGSMAILGEGVVETRLGYCVMGE